MVRVAQARNGSLAHSQVVVRVVSNDGTVERGVLLAEDDAARTATWRNRSIGVQSRFFPKAGATAVTPVVCQAGDRLVVELGWRAGNTSTSSLGADMNFGDAAAEDLPENETEDAALNPWVQFSDTVVFQ